MNSIFRRALRPALCIIMAGCASAGNGAPSGSAPPVSQRRSDRSVISADEIAASQETNLYDLVRSLRVEWLTARGAAASSPGVGATSGGSGRSRSSSNTATTAGFATALQVYMNRQKLGTVDELKNMSTMGVASLKYYDPTEAQGMFGPDNSSGAIQVIPVSGGGKPD